MAHPFKHFSTITRHRHAVIRHCFKVGIGFQGLFHDLSKYSPTEFIPGAKYYQGTRSPNEQERELYGYSRAWLHHMGRNKHHYEYWRDVDPKIKRYMPVKMPTRYLAEMFCDRVAASKIYKGKNYTDDESLKYFLRGNAKTTMHPETAAELEAWLTLLAEQGEDIAFAAVRKAVKAAKTAEKRRKPDNF